MEIIISNFTKILKGPIAVDAISCTHTIFQKKKGFPFICIRIYLYHCSQYGTIGHCEIRKRLCLTPPVKLPDGVKELIRGHWTITNSQKRKIKHLD